MSLRVPLCAAWLVVAGLTACRSAQVPRARVDAAKGAQVTNQEYVGFDRNEYPGDARLAELRHSFAFVGYWLNNPPGATSNGWVGKRRVLRDAGFGFLILANGRLDAEIKKAKVTPDALGKQDAAAAIAAAKREGFPEGAILFLDQEEGGRLLPEQAGYFFGWTEAVAGSAYKAGAYLSGQESPDGTGPDGKPSMVTTAEDVRETIAAKKLHAVAFWVAQDACPPAPGCTAAAPKLKESGTFDARVWQYAQSPRRPELTRSCGKTYGADGNCYAGATKDLFLDLDVAAEADPSHGR